MRTEPNAANESIVSGTPSEQNYLAAWYGTTPFPTPIGSCPRCGWTRYANLTHLCSTLPITRLSPAGGGPNPWGNRAR